MTRTLHPDTLAIHGGQVPDPTTGSVSVPIYQTTAYKFRDADHAANLFALRELGNIYTRIMNPTTDVLERRMSLLEGGSAAVAFASGQSAETLSILNIAHAGDEIAASATLYGGTYNLFRHTFPKMGLNVRFFDASDPSTIAQAITKKTKAVYAESLGNPKLDVPDLPLIAAQAHAAGLPLIVDNTMTTPCILRPIDHGADIVVHSLTKYAGGHGNSMGGVAVDSGKFNWGNGNFPNFTGPDPSYSGISHWDAFKDFADMGNVAFAMKLRLQLLRDVGPCLAPMNSWLILQGLETLPVRMERHCRNAEKVAEFLANHPRVAWVTYPGRKDHPSHEVAKRLFLGGMFGGMLGFGVKGGYEAGKKFINAVKLCIHVTNLGDVRTLVTHPASTTHQQMAPDARAAAGVTDDFIRMSIGLEHAEDVMADLDQALAASATK